MPTISIYLYTGDFPLAYQNHSAGLPQTYATHDALIAAIHQLLVAGFRVRMVSFITEAQRTIQVEGGALEFVELGATAYNTRGMLRTHVRDNPADLVVAHFANPEMIAAAIGGPGRTMAVLANSYDTSIRSRLRARRIVKLLNSPSVEWVANHCIPSTMHLADLGVVRTKLVPWDVPHSPTPYDTVAKAAPRSEPHVLYVGSVWEAKGVTDLIDAIGILRREGLDLHLEALGNGPLDDMRARARAAGVDDLVSLPGPVDNVEVSRRMADADLVAVPSRHRYPEGLPLTLFEAVASRTPIVCSDHPMFRLHFRDGESAVTFAGGDPRDLARALRRALTDTELYARLSSGADRTWSSLTCTAPFGDLINRWALDEHPSSWIADHTLDRMLERLG